MTALSTGLTIFSEPLMLVVLIALVFGALEAERIWTRSQRRRGLTPGAVAYLLDGLVIVSALLTLVGAATLFVEGLMSIAATVGEVVNGERVGLLIVGMALALGLAMALVRAASGHRAAQEAAIARAAAMPPMNSAMFAADARLASAPEQQPAYLATQRERYEESAMPALAMMQERWQPGATAAARVPTSFLDMIEPPAPPPARSRFALASTLLMLALVVMVVSGALLFRHQLMNVLSGMEASYGNGGVANTSAPPNPPAASAANAAANVAAAAAPVASAPTAAAVVAPAAPPAANDAQGAQKRVKSNGLNLRALPGTDQQVVAVLKQGDVVTVFNDARLIREAIWVKVRAGENEGWVDQSLLE